jgi:hypothetical protein
MNNTIKFVAVCVAAPVMALGVAAPTAWAQVHPHGGGVQFDEPPPPLVEPEIGIFKLEHHMPHVAGQPLGRPIGVERLH